MFLLRPPAIADVQHVIGPALDAARDRGVRHVVFLSIQGAERNRLVPHRKIEDHLRQNDQAWTFVRATWPRSSLGHSPRMATRGRPTRPQARLR